MNWKIKAGLQNSIAAVPYFSRPIYYAVQRCFGGLRRNRINPLSRLSAAAQMVDLAESVGVEVTGKTVFEVGTGHMVDLPIGMWLCGAARVITVDLNPYLSLRLISEAREFVRKNATQVEELFARRRSKLFDERLQVLIGSAVPDKELLKVANIDYLAPADAAHLPLAANSIDLHVSHTVLEHVPPEVLSAILVEARRILRADGLLIHDIDPSDHFAHDDASITRINMLRFTDAEWRRLAGNRFMYHNRLRAPEFVRLFEGNGVRILKDERSIDERSKAALQAGFRVRSRFSEFSDDDLATTTISIVGHFADAGRDVPDSVVTRSSI